MIYIPDLEQHCGSWIVSRRNGEVIGEFYERKSVALFDPATCFVETSAQYLARVNAALRDVKA